MGDYFAGHPRWRRNYTVTAGVLMAVLGFASTHPAQARELRDDGTATVTITVPTVMPTVEPSSRPTPVPSPTTAARPTVPPTPSRVARERPRSRHRARAHHRRHRSSRQQPAPTFTPVPSATARPHRHHARRKREATATAAPTVTPSPTATPTPTPPINLQTEDSITPVHCNGQPRPDAARPFLTPPYRGWTSIVSYFDHDLPNFSKDGVVVIANGLRAEPDAQHQAIDFPAYWNRSIRQFVYYDGHNGYDFNLWYQPVYAAASGKVIFAGLEYPNAPDHGYGYMVMVNHYHGYITLYGHFSKLLVKRGQRVRRGQELGISGNSGHSSGPHLHFTVFHNCTPTDPYGWSGGGDDPLATYQNETSTYLWISPPPVMNPLRDWPGLSSLPATGATRLLLLRLPSTRSGAGAFVASLKAEARAVLRAVRGSSGFHADDLRGAVVVKARVTASELYNLPGVVSIASTDAADDARADVLRALGQAALRTSHPRMHLAHSSSWTGYLFQWHGRTFLLGQGVRGKQVSLRLAGARAFKPRLIKADPTNGAYAVDLGKLSRGQISSLTADLKGRAHGKSSLVLQPRIPERSRGTDPSRRQPESVNSGMVATSILVVVLLIVLAVTARTYPLFRGRRS